jgi:hypothetical protein
VLLFYFKVAWLLVGSIMFWGYYYQSGLCGYNLSSYVWFKLIYEWILIVLLSIEWIVYE